MELKDIGLRIKYLRSAAGMTQKDLADKIGVTWEMVSRYETGKSAPFNKLTEIADALDANVTSLVSKVSLEDSPPMYGRSTVPLISSPISDLAEAIRETKQFYVAPDWVVHSSIKPFAANTSSIKIETGKIKKNGVLFVSTEMPNSSDDLILALEDETIVVQPYGMKKSKSKILGVVVAYEQRFR